MQLRFGRIDLGRESGDLVVQRRFALAQLIELRADRSLLLRDVAHSIEPALQLRSHLRQARAIGLHHIRLAAPQLIGHGGFGLQRGELRRQCFERQFAQLRFRLLQDRRALGDVGLQLIFFGLQLRVLIGQGRQLGLHLRDQALPPIDGALRVFQLPIEGAALFGLAADRLLGRAHLIGYGGELLSQIVDVVAGSRVLRGGLLRVSFGFVDARGQFAPFAFARQKFAGAGRAAQRDQTAGVQHFAAARGDAIPVGQLRPQGFRLARRLDDDHVREQRFNGRAQIVVARQARTGEFEIVGQLRANRLE